MYAYIYAYIYVCSFYVNIDIVDSNIQYYLCHRIYNTQYQLHVSIRSYINDIYLYVQLSSTPIYWFRYKITFYHILHLHYEHSLIDLLIFFFFSYFLTESFS